MEPPGAFRRRGHLPRVLLGKDMSGLIAPDDRATKLVPRAQPLSSRFNSPIPVDCAPEPRMFKPANETTRLAGIGRRPSPLGFRETWLDRPQPASDSR
jgi:hypothetical protein